KDGVAKATVHIYGRVTSLTRRPVNWFENTVTANIPAAMLQKARDGSQIYSKRIPLPPGTYRLNIVAKDTVGNTMNTYEKALHVPYYQDDKLASSSLILADEIEHVPSRSIGKGQFVIRSTKVRPRVGDTFKRSESMGIYTELYNLGGNKKTHKPQGTVEYEVVNDKTKKLVLSHTEALQSIPNASGYMAIVEKKLPLNVLKPGKYTLKLKVTDQINKQTITPSAQFTVTS
ncbi:MAG: GWxTD domain-containing protein, partial [Bryobacteraceae bacterium]